MGCVVCAGGCVWVGRWVWACVGGCGNLNIIIKKIFIRFIIRFLKF